MKTVICRCVDYGQAEADTCVVGANAVDIGPFDATAWLSQHGAEIDQGCPLMYADPAEDPRMQP